MNLRNFVKSSHIYLKSQFTLDRRSHHNSYLVEESAKKTYTEEKLTKMKLKLDYVALLLDHSIKLEQYLLKVKNIIQRLLQNKVK